MTAEEPDHICAYITQNLIRAAIHKGLVGVFTYIAVYYVSTCSL